MRTFADVNIEIPNGAPGPEVQTRCPQCSNQRRKRNAKPLSVNTDKRVWVCHHCGWTGSLGRAASSPETLHRQQSKHRRPDPRPASPLPEAALAWFRSRGITEDVLARNRIGFAIAYMPQLEERVPVVLFPYTRDGEELNRKHRTIARKHFRLEPGCELVLYGLDDIDPGKPLVWVEGEVDKLSLEVAGFASAVSVPNGAPAPGSKRYAAHFGFLEADREKIEAVQHHVLAVDSDAPGRALEEELARRLGPERCSRVRWPEGCKDANDVLVKHGADELRRIIEHAQPLPIEGAFRLEDRRDDIEALYEHGFERGVRTGWTKLDRHYTVRPGELTVVTGIPSSGKSNFIDCLLVNLARLHGWRFAIFSPENLPLEQHMAAIAEKYTRKPFHQGPTSRMTPPELARAMAWVDDHFYWIMPSSEDDWTVDKVLGTAAKLCLRYGVRGLVIDPWNELEALRPHGMSETEYVSHVLKRVRVFARQRGIHVWLVVHPAKLYRSDDGRYPVPTLYDCSGSAHWRNKADNGLVVWRDLSEEDNDEVQIHVQKIRFRHVGRRGMVRLFFEPACATYRDHENDRYAPPDDDEPEEPEWLDPDQNPDDRETFSEGETLYEFDPTVESEAEAANEADPGREAA